MKRFVLFVSVLALTACSHGGKKETHALDLDVLHIVGTGIHPTESTTSIDARAHAWCAARMAGKNSLQANSSAYPGWGSELTLAQVSAFSASARAAFCPTVSP